MTEQVTGIIRRAKHVEKPMAFECSAPTKYAGRLVFPPGTGWLLWIISDHEAYWIHTKTDKVVASSRNY